MNTKGKWKGERYIKGKGAWKGNYKRKRERGKEYKREREREVQKERERAN